MRRMTRGGVALLLVGALGGAGCAGASRAGANRAPAREASPARETETPLTAPPREPPSGEERSGRDAFAQRALETLRASGETRAIHYDPDAFLLRIGGDDGTASTVFLSNFFAEYTALPEAQRPEVLARLTRMRTAPALPATFAEARPHVLPVVRGRTFFEQLWLVVKGSPEAPPVSSKPLGGALAVGVAFDGPDTLRYLGPEELRRWGVDFEQVLAAALENLRQRSPEPLQPLAPGTCQAPWNDNYAASRLLLDEVVRRCPVRGQPVVLVPHRDLLLITGSEDEDGLRRISASALQAIMAPHALDGRALRLTPEGWVPFMPERLSDAWGDFRKLELFTWARDYTEQGERMEKYYQGRGERPFVATYTPYQDERGHSVSYAVWLKDVDTLLPRTDVLFLVDPALGEDAPPVAVARWDEVMKQSGALFVPVPGFYPVRYRVRGFPSPEQLTRWKSDPGNLFEEGEP